MWDLSCVDWEERIASGRSLVPDLPLNRPEVRDGLAIFDELQLPDVPGKPRMRDAAGQWFRDIVAAHFGSWFPDRQENAIRDIFCLAPKGSSKTTYGGALALTAMIMNRRPRAEALFIGPTQSISDRAYEQAVGMIEESADLKNRFHPRDHVKTIEDRVTKSELRVKTFDLNILTGSILIYAHLDEIHLLGRTSYAGRVIRQIRGGLDKTPEGKFLITTTQSDDAPAGAFRDELINARKMRDGHYRGRLVRPMLPILYEFPERIGRDPALWQDPEAWRMVQPNLGRSVHLATLVPDYNTESEKGDHARRVWASQYLNIEIGVGIKTDLWPGAEYWEEAEDPALTLDSLLDRCDCVVVGLDGGGLDDIHGVTVLGRDRVTREWLSVSFGWCHQSVLDRRQTIAARLHGFAEDGDLTICGDDLQDIADIVAMIEGIKERGILARVAADPAGLGEMVEALAEIGVTEEAGLLSGVPQGYALMNAIKTAERKLANGTLKVARQPLMRWCVGNLKIEPTATAIRATKQNAGDAKIDPAMALFNAVTIMVKNPEAAPVLNIAAMVA